MPFVDKDNYVMCLRLAVRSQLDKYVEFRHCTIPVIKKNNNVKQYLTRFNTIAIQSSMLLVARKTWA